MATSTILNFINTPKASTHYGEYSYDVSWSLMKEIKLKNPPFFISMATAAKFVLPIPIFLAYLIPLEVDVTGNITAKICEVWSEFNIFCTLVTMAMATILKKKSTPPPKKSCCTLRWIFLWSLMKGIKKKIKNPPLFVSMATAAKFVQPIPICLAYLVPLDVDVVSIKFHQFLFSK